jgi:hypothetical protein
MGRAAVYVVVVVVEKLKLLVPPPFFLVGAAVAVTFESIVVPLGSTGYISRANNTRARIARPPWISRMQIFDSCLICPDKRTLDSHTKQRESVTKLPTAHLAGERARGDAHT